MGSDSGLSRSSGCPEKCEAQAIRWQNRTGCQGGKVALIWRKAKESACQLCSAKPKHGRKNGGKRLRWGKNRKHHCMECVRVSRGKIVARGSKCFKNKGECVRHSGDQCLRFNLSIAMDKSPHSVYSL
ncbi:uncharacterized [Tachysurus ichikawai]